MSLILPMEALSSMQVSFKVTFTDGSFAFSIGDSPVEPSSRNSMPHEGQLHLHAVGDASGISLTIFTSGKAKTSSNEVELASAISMFDTMTPSVPIDCGTALSASFPGCFSDALSLDASLDIFDSKNMQDDASVLFDAPMIDDNCRGLMSGSDDINVLRDEDGSQKDFNEYYLSGITSPAPSDAESSAPSAVSSPSSIHSSSPTPRTPIESELPLSDPQCPRISQSSTTRPRQRKLTCPHPSCSRSSGFRSEYTLSRHLRTHDAKKSNRTFPCTMGSGCALSFSRKHDRLRHEVQQHGRVCEWRCNLCMKFFSAELTLMNHKCHTPAPQVYREESE